MNDNTQNMNNRTPFPFRIGNGYDVHAMENGIPMWLGGIQIESEKGFVAHSDGDVAIHALCDALLGCLALGDIGHYFPDTSDDWKDVDSKVLLKIVCNQIRQLGWEIGNTDITIALQKPKIGHLVESMRATLAKVMEIDINCVSIKASTNERLGFVGRCEGCQVWASALIYQNPSH